MHSNSVQWTDILSQVESNEWKNQKEIDQKRRENPNSALMPLAFYNRKVKVRLFTEEYANIHIKLHQVMVVHQHYFLSLFSLPWLMLSENRRAPASVYIYQCSIFLSLHEEKSTGFILHSRVVSNLIEISIFSCWSSSLKVVVWPLPFQESAVHHSGHIHDKEL